MKFENLLAEIDGFGKFQFLIVLLLLIPRWTLPGHFLLNNFIAAIPDHRCDIRGLDDGEVFANLTQDQRLTVSIPAQDDGSLSSCKMFREPQFHLLYNSSNATEIPAVPCVEWVDIEHRTLIGVIISMDWTLATMMLPGLAYLMNEWRWLVIAVTSPLLLAMVTWWWVPESARWLIANGKVEEAHMYLEKCAKINNREAFVADIKPETLANIVVVERGNASYSYLDLVKTPKMRKLALLTGTV
ncbi:hypothetical protein SKAU_G00180980 [Synaphobranchus kaupii]|uniref:Uncharacterized protein n=1 Tax=Synaphobranchus kaupii TaxID=118154 RepID=A0A9Q1FML8_SYNKA|nr:hypothetical protein SKAU_G00180980 [Synaphobranchus kaupii]